MLDKIIITNTAWDPPKPANGATIHASTKKAARIDLLKAALHAISEANTAEDREARRIAIAEYTRWYQHALDDGIAASELRKRCENTYLRCMAACLRAIAWAVVDGHADRREKLVDWYEDDRQRMIDAGFKPFSVDARASSRVWKGIR